MRRWLDANAAAAARAADDPWLWLPGALAWIATIGWIPLLVVVWTPSVSGLTYFGSGFFSSGAWPWNAVAVAIALAALAAIAFLLAAIGEAALLGVLSRRRVDGTDVARLVGIAVVTAAPAILLGLVTAIAAVVIAPSEFNAPAAEPGPITRTVLRLAPLLAVAAVAAVGGAALHAAAGRSALAHGGTMVGALARGVRDLRNAGLPAAVQAVGLALARVAHLAFGVILLSVLWAPIGVRLRDGIEAATVLLLVGFVAIWICLVLGGGAVQAWGSAAWNGILVDRSTAPRIIEPTEAPTRT
jgi:hypothetical protein